MTPWFIATEQFTPECGKRWDDYIRWSGLTQLEEVVSLDGTLCPPVLGGQGGIKDEYWPHIVNEDFMLDFFVDFEFMKQEIARFRQRLNVLCVFRNPEAQPVPPSPAFEFVGYDLVDVHGSNSALTNCGGFPEAFQNSALSRHGLLPDFDRAVVVQRILRAKYGDEAHANCHLWAIFRTTGENLE